MIGTPQGAVMLPIIAFLAYLGTRRAMTHEAEARP